MKKLIISAIVLVLATQFSLNAQDPQFSQFYANPVYLNPAMVGTANQHRASVIHRQQGDVDFGYTTSAFSYDASLAGNSGWGVQVINDNQSGMISSKFYNFSLSHRINISKESQLGLGIRAGGYSRKLDFSKLTFEDQLDGRNGIVRGSDEPLAGDRLSNVDIAVGMLYSSKNFFAGLNVNHVNRPKENFISDVESTLPMRYTFHAGGFLFSKNYRRQTYVLSPNIVYERQGSFNYLNLGMYFSTEVWTVGAWYRWDDAVVASLGVNFGKFKVGYSYDLPVKSYDSMVGTAHEVSLAYHFKPIKKFKVRNKYKGQCPSFQKYLY